ncbi:MAG: type II toxin-antitoxin system prevent-host-death family antitoxin [Actinomycetota bacterium]|nr:type II toxin-antitoxin system prevent-host-death family antitoxin [Actinomycetota bacterium]MDQ3085203.1 type II toxin-antitoxin system prevent-host-death family antitoxin [Actinomycetota bacterium]MDQ3424760.1 type II toxin-antitoxin system prevent-host-death family antitoxin [Actinomycetota bacterium]
MPTQMGIRELRDTLTHAIRRVRAGETIEVTHDGEPVAVISPYRRSRLDQLIAEGRATPGRPFRAPTRLIEAKGPRSASEIIREGREDR